MHNKVILLNWSYNFSKNWGTNLSFKCKEFSLSQTLREANSTSLTQSNWWENSIFTHLESYLRIIWENKPDFLDGGAIEGNAEFRSWRSTCKKPKNILNIHSCGIHGYDPFNPLKNNISTKRLNFTGYDLIEWLMERLGIEESGG